jgi:hypothetical protein
MMSKVKYLRFVSHGEPQFEADTWALHLGRKNNFNSRMNFFSCRYILYYITELCNVLVHEVDWLHCL